ncbi:MAG: hypothetical protein AABO41_21925 [Acidobacteriota bacterium]
MRGHCARRPTWAKRAANGACLAAVIVLSLVANGTAQDREGAARLKKETAKRVKQYPGSPVQFTNFEAVPLSIQSANAKEIGNAEYLALVGSATDSPRYTTFPRVMITNRTDQRVTGLVLMYGNKQTRKIRGVSFTKLSIDPHGTFAVEPSDWVLPERTVRIADDGKVTSRLKPGLDSEKMWSHGSAHEMLVRIAAVVFEDGKRWEMSSDMDW